MHPTPPDPPLPAVEGRSTNGESAVELTDLCGFADWKSLELCNINKNGFGFSAAKRTYLQKLFVIPGR